MKYMEEKNNYKINFNSGKNCEICDEHIDGWNKPICDECMEALKELILEKKEQKKNLTK